VSQLTVAFRGSRSLSSSGPLYHEAALSTSSSEWPVCRPARPTRERLRAGSCRLGPRSRCCVSLEQAARDSRSGCPPSICRSQERSRHRHGPRRLSHCGVVARYEREDPFATTTADESRSTRFCGVHRPGSSQGQPSWPRHGRWRVATEARAERAQPVDHDQSAFQGIHAESTDVGRQACGVPKSIFDAVDALATSSNGRVLAIWQP
jgi:hypothetical protein